MRKMRKLLIYLSVGGLTFGYLMLSFLALPQKAAAADPMAVGGEEVSLVLETAPVDLTSGVSCEEPSADSAHVYDGLIPGVEQSYFGTASQISGNWNGFSVEDPENCPITQYKYLIKKITSPKTVIVDWTVPADPLATSITHTGLTLEEGAEYIIKVKAKNKGGWSDIINSSGQTLDLDDPSEVVDLTLTHDALSNPIVNLSWSASIDDLSGVAGYEIYRSMSPFEKIGETSGTTFQDTVFADDLLVSYKVIAVDNVGNASDDSNIVSTMVDDIAPGAPVISSNICSGRVNVTWPAVPGASSYVVYRDGDPIAVGGALNYLDTLAKKGTTHSYYVVAYDEAGNASPVSNTLIVYTPKPRISSVSTSGEVLGAITGAGEAQAQTQISPSTSPSPSGSVQASESSVPEETAESGKTNWSLIIAIIIAAAIVIAGVLYWWYAREEDEDEI